MLPLDRRQFLGQSAAALGAAAMLAKPLAASPAGQATATRAGDLVTLGRSGVKTSLLGIGTGSNGVGRSSNQVKLGQEKFNKLLAHAFDRGIRYIDTADQYGSHIFVREAIRAAKMPREKLFIQTKTRALNAEVAKADIERFREELGTDYIDSLLMHCMTKINWPTDMRPVMDVLDNAKAKGMVKAVGVSCHGLPPLQTAAATDWIDIDLARINPLGGNKGRMDSTPPVVAGLLKQMHDKGKGILGMKILAEGDLKKPEQKRESLKFVMGLGCVDAFVIGFEKPEQIDEICGMIEDVGRVV
ncbi:MAG TPA: aldo/keto reductase [Gemmataceae bacterium]|nr:aldo/keto reductase [Gemmataceae bacterium]